ncbi:FAD-dependent monooxygenase [Actinomadura barringtoniae]|uniref:FAD-dependent monooxygenase n=1 Tax=Actinomadura barringtoniae TaxID=1427535 RepID=A0A939PHA8_9ACTN|nr:NAD(P)/FAD-dependent oxidoreductase [Actinomadura barringtoniae]MBO2452640.1 FAD-dependent monooxygenase [Actinomadura barringtoniae]
MRVTVIGGGVAGATSAIALRRIGAEVTVYEAYADPAGPVGSFLSLATNGLRCLRALGCLEAVRAAGHDIGHQRLWSDTGRLLGAMPRGRLTGDPLHSVTLMRGRLVETLRAEAVRAGARIVTGERLVGASESDSSVTAEFESGLTVEADLLVGADGIWSATRRILDPGAPEPTYAGLFTASGVASGVEVEAGTFNMIFGRNGAFAYVGMPGGETWWAAQVADPAQPDLASVDLDALRHLYRHEEMARTLLSAATTMQRPTLMHVLGEVPVWHGERIVLVGDSGHPVGAGQGASMAIEDAVVLARALETADVPAALAAYDGERRKRMAKMVKAASDNRDAKTAGPVARRVRNVVMPLATRLFYERATSWLYTHDVTEGWRPSTAALTQA